MAEPNFYEVEGQTPEGNWVGLYQAVTQDEGRLMLAAVLETGDAPAHERFEDFRLVPPTGDSHPPRVRGFADGWTWKQREHAREPRTTTRRLQRTRARRAS